jgi:hypothetical protein
MNRNSTLVGLCMLILLTSFATNSLKAQNNALPQLFAGTVSFRVVLGLVVGPQEDSNGKNQYSFKDNDNEMLKHNVIYYRLKQVDLNNNYTLSIVQMIRLNNINKEGLVMRAMPNPYMDKLSVDFDSKNDGNAEIRMISISESIVKSIKTTINKGINTVQLQDLSSQLTGMYLINIVVNGLSIGSREIIKT